MIEWGLYAMVGIFAGLSAGMLGLGGGLIIVPSLLMVFSWQAMPETQLMHFAVGTSLMTITVTSISSLYAHQKHGNINWQITRRLMPGLISGGLFGAYLATLLTSDLLQQIFAIYAFVMALRMWFPVSLSIKNGLLNKVTLQLAGAVIGSISALVGIGGGTLIVPYLVMAKQMMQRAIGTSAACGLPISIAAVAGYMIFGQPEQTINGVWQTGFIHWHAFWGIVSTSIVAAPLGALWAKRLPINRLRQLFSLVLLMVALYLLNS